MTPSQREHKKEIKRREKLLEERPPVTVREVVLIVLVGVVAALSMYVSNDSSRSFGLLDQPAIATELQVISSFRQDVLIERPFLELDLTVEGEGSEPIEGRLFDVTTPPSVNDLTALNSRIGGEVVLYWDRHSDVDQVNIYRTQETAAVVDEDGQVVTPAKEALLAEGVIEETFVDTEVKNLEVYTYRVVSVTSDGVNTYTSPDQTVTVIPEDVIPPNPPTDVIVAEYHAQESGGGILLTWEHPTDTDFDRIDVYRSDEYTRRGSVLAAVQADEEATYLDKTAEPNILYFYTLIAVDKAGNESGHDFQLPVVGNASPFTPFTSEE